jgi:long-chain fatty acid transport protein
MKKRAIAPLQGAEIQCIRFSTAISPLRGDLRQCSSILFQNSPLQTDTSPPQNLNSRAPGTGQSAIEKNFSLLCLLMAMDMSFAGGLVTNTNQSAAWARMLVRDASTSIDAAYYNPAGLTKLSDGLHISVSNQSIFQNRTISNSLFPGREWEGKVSAPLFPNFYAAYKTGKFAFSLGFTPIGGGGSANYEKGIPMIELPLLQLYELPGVTGHSVNASFEGSSVYFGLQGGISYAINDMISVYAGARYVMAKNSYIGEVKDISVVTAGGTVRADTYMNTLAGQLDAGATQLYGAADNVNALAGSFGGTTTFDQAIAAAAGNPTLQGQITALRDGLTGLGVANAGSLTLAVGEVTYDTYGSGYAAQADELQAGALLMADQEADVIQKGSGFTPIIGLNLALLEDKLNIGVKYEFKTSMTITNETPAGKGFVIGMTETGTPVEMFPDGEETNADMPAMLSIGLNYKFTDKFSTMIGYHTYFDKEAGWATIEGTDISVIDKNYWELGIGLEYALSDKFLLSGGFLRAQSGVNDYYHDDMSYSLKSNTFGLGGAFRLNDMMLLNFGGYKTVYTDATITDPFTEAYSQTYKKSNIAFAIGLDLTFGGK